MKRRFVVLGVLAALATAAIVSPAVGGPNFLTLKKAKKVFFTKKQTNARFLRKSAGYTRGQADAAFLNEAEGDARYLPASGGTRLQVSPDSWVPASPDVFVERHFGLATMKTTAPASDKLFFASLALPSPVQGAEVAIESLELCYSATSASATLDFVALNITRNVTAADPFPITDEAILDSTDRDDQTCRTYTAGGAVPIGPNDFPQLAIRVDFAAGAGTVSISRTDDQPRDLKAHERQEMTRASLTSSSSAWPSRPSQRWPLAPAPRCSRARRRSTSNSFASTACSPHPTPPANATGESPSIVIDGNHVNTAGFDTTDRNGKWRTSTAFLDPTGKYKATTPAKALPRRNGQARRCAAVTKTRDFG